MLFNFNRQEIGNEYFHGLQVFQQKIKVDSKRKDFQIEESSIK